MNQLILFLNSFMEYLIVFGIFVVSIIIACLIGMNLKKRKNAKVSQEEKTVKTES